MEVRKTSVQLKSSGGLKISARLLQCLGSILRGTFRVPKGPKGLQGGVFKYLGRIS